MGHTLPVTFTDESTSASDNLIFILIHSKQSISINLNHIGVVINVARFSDSFLNVAISFNKMADSNIEKAIIEKMDLHSLCVSGCPRREKLNIFKSLKDELLDEKLDNLIKFINSDENGTESAEHRVQLVKDLNLDLGLESNKINGCLNLVHYYRVACLYDYLLKGLNQSPNSSKFAQNLDHHLNQDVHKLDFNLFDFKSAKIKLSSNLFITILFCISQIAKYFYAF